MKKFNYFVTIGKNSGLVGFSVELAGDTHRLSDRWYLPVSKKLFDELYNFFNICNCYCYYESFDEVKND